MNGSMKESMKESMKGYVNGFYLVVVALLVGMYCLPVHGRGTDVQINATVSADKIGRDDVLVYTVTLQGADSPVQPDVSHFSDFRVAQTSRGTEFRFINGVSSHQTNFVYYLVPLKTGRLTIPSVTHTHGGKEYKTRPLTVEVVDGSVSPPNQNQGRRGRSFFDRDDFFGSRRSRRPQQVAVHVAARVSRETAVKGQQLMFSVLLYTRNRIQSVNMVSNQSIPGFWQEWYPVSRSIEGRSETLNGRVYQVYEIRKAALFPSKTGTLTIPPLEFELGLIADDPFSFFDNTRPIRRSTKPLTLRVSAPPAAAAGLPVGQFQLDLRPDKKEVNINDILTLKIRVSGSGNIKTLTPPELTSSDYFKIYPAKISRDVNFDGGGNSLTGYVEAEIPVSFKKPGLVSFPPLEFRYYDVAQSRVVTLNHAPLAIRVTGEKEKEEQVATLPRTEIIKTGEDIDFIKKGDIHNQEETLYHGGYFVILLLVPFLLNGVFIFKVLVFDRFIARSSHMKNRKILGTALKELNRVDDAGEISPVLERYLTRKTGLGLSDMNGPNIRRILEKYGVDTGAIDALIDIKSRSESSRFSPQKQSEGLKNDLRRMADILKTVDGKVKS